ncbi:MAG TPA: hypothetical protein VIQ03_00320 [Gammaproteobacteria bacterium]
MKHLSLLVPGLLGPLPELKQYSGIVPRCNVLEKWLSRGDVLSTSCFNYFQQLADLLSINKDFSIAYVSAMIDGFDPSQGYWYRADPVHFRADMDHAILLDHEMLDIAQHEADKLIHLFNEHFMDDGLQLFSRHPARWYLQSTVPFDISATQLSDAIGRNVTHFLPQGEHALRWRRFLNETQMLFHEHAVNVERASSGKLAINSLWLWGEGQDMHYDDHKTFQWMMAKETVAVGLANILGIETSPLEEFNSMAGLQGNGLMIIDDLLSPASYGDVEKWGQALEKLCDLWLAPLQKLMQKGIVKQIDLYTAEGRQFVITPRSQYKFWRRTSPLTSYIADNA